MVSGKKIGHTLLLFFLMLGGSSTSQSLIKKYFYTNHHLRMLNAKPVDATSFLVAVQTDDGRSGIIKFNSNGDTVWTYFVSGVIPVVFYPANGNGTFAVKADKGCIFIHTPVNHDRFFLTELDSNGAVISSKFYSGPSCNE